MEGEGRSVGHRQLVPDLGRFISRDPIGFKGGLNLYNGAGTNPVTMVDPTGREVDVRFRDGTWKTATSPQELETLIKEAANGSIATMNSRGHGSPGNCGFDVDDENADGIWVQPLPNDSEKFRVLLSTGVPKEPNFVDILKPKLAPGATIWLMTCYSGTRVSSMGSTAQVISEQLPGVYVQGNAGTLHSLFGIDYGVYPGPLDKTGKVKVFLNGSEVDNADIIRGAYGIIPRR